MNEAFNGYKASVVVPAAAVRTWADRIEAAFEDDDHPPAIASFEEPNETGWRIELYFTDCPDERRLRAILASLNADGNLPNPDPVIETVPDIDWVAASQKLRKPVSAGRYYIHGGHDAPTRRKGAIDLLIEAGQAFGTGQHESTYGCLLMMSRLKSSGCTPYNALDLGCGSGVLALAAAKTWRIPVVAADIDPRAIIITTENAEKNAVPVLSGCGSDWGIIPVEAAGTIHPQIASAGPYALVLANILAGPLVDLAPTIAACMAPEGNLVLSGILNEQAERVTRTYESHDLVEHDRVTAGRWPTILLSRRR